MCQGDSMLILAFNSTVKLGVGKGYDFFFNVMGQCLGIFTVIPSITNPLNSLVPLTIFLTFSEQYLFPQFQMLHLCVWGYVFNWRILGNSMFF